MVSMKRTWDHGIMGTFISLRWPGQQSPTAAWSTWTRYYGKIYHFYPFFMGKSTLNGIFFTSKLLVYQEGKWDYNDLMANRTNRDKHTIVVMIVVVIWPLTAGTGIGVLIPFTTDKSHNCNKMGTELLKIPRLIGSNILSEFLGIVNYDVLSQYMIPANRFQPSMPWDGIGVFLMSQLLVHQIGFATQISAKSAAVSSPEFSC